MLDFNWERGAHCSNPHLATVRGTATARGTATVTATATAQSLSPSPSPSPLPSLGEGYYNATSYNYATLALYVTSCYNATLE